MAPTRHVSTLSDHSVSQAFLLQPVAVGGMLSEDELVFFSLAVLDVFQKYTKMKKAIANVKEEKCLEFAIGEA